MRKRDATKKWRPTLWMIVTAMIVAALMLPLTAVLFFRIYENQLVRNTEAELIAQSAAVAAMMSTWLEANGDADLPLGREVPPRPSLDEDRWSPTLPQLNLHKTQILPERPDAQNTEADAPPLYLRAAAALDPILERTQRATLAGFRVLDFRGTVIAGGDDVGLSYAHLPEVQAALDGQYRSVLRERQVRRPQPIYSISRGTKVRLFTALPVVVKDRLAGVVYASRTPSNVIKEFYFLRERLALAALAICAFALLMVFIFSRTVASPIRRLRDRAQRIGRDEREAIGPLRHHGSREVYELSNTLMDMSRKLFDKTDYINSFATHVSHELKSPLSSISGAVELLKDGGMTEEQQTKFLENIGRDANRGIALLERLRALAKADNTDIGGSCIVSDVLSACRKHFPTLEVTLSGDAVLPMSAENAAIVFHNLIDNALNHGARAILVVPSCHHGILTVDVTDDGAGISEGNAPRIFDLFFTTRRQHGGTGLGLGIVRSLLRAHGGSIIALPSDKGAHFQITGLKQQ